MEARLIGTASASSFSCWKSHLESPLPLQNRLKGENISMTQLKHKMLGYDFHLNSLSQKSEEIRKIKLFFAQIASERLLVPVTQMIGLGAIR